MAEKDQAPSPDDPAGSDKSAPSDKGPSGGDDSEMTMLPFPAPGIDEINHSDDFPRRKKTDRE